MEEFADASPALQAALSDWHALAAQAFKHAREAKLADLAADQADKTHKNAVREALTGNKDASKVNPSDGGKLREDAAKHRELYDAAHTARTRLGFDLAPLLEAEAASRIPAVDLRVTQHADRIRPLFEQIRDAYSAWFDAFQLRLWWSHVDLNGGMVPTYQGGAALPRDVVAALDTLTDHLASPGRLRSDEQQVREYRADNA